MSAVAGLIAVRGPEVKLDVAILRLEVAADAAERALDLLLGLELPHLAEQIAEVRVVRQGLRWGDVLELHAHGAAGEACA